MDDSDLLLDYENDSALELNSPDLRTKPKDNLKISIDNEHDPDTAVTFVKLEPEESHVQTEPSVDAEVEVTLASTINQSKSRYQTYQDKAKQYENSGVGDFAVGIELTSEEARIKRKERAKRFGVEEEVIADKALDINALYASLGITDGDLKETGSRQIRRNVIMLRGVDEMSTQDIFTYFNKYPPRNLEWIDDTSCNVVFSSNECVSRALVNMSQPIKTSHVPDRSSKAKVCRESVELTNSMEMNQSSDEMVKDPGKNADQPEALVLDSPSTPMEEGEITAEDSYGVYLDENEVPPGKWRLATEFSKARSRLFMRFATKADVKIKGSEQKSQYYRKHGNPNYGGLAGLISKSKKQRFRKAQDRLLEEEAKRAVLDQGRSKVAYDNEDLFGEVYEEANSSERLTSSPADTELASIHRARKRGRVLTDRDDLRNNLLASELPVEKKQRPMMKMAADEEQEKQDRVRAHSEAVVASLDVRNKLNRLQSDRSSIESHKPDLRSRLSRKNDW